jgi:hypothetical protein
MTDKFDADKFLTEEDGEFNPDKFLSSDDTPSDIPELEEEPKPILQTVSEGVESAAKATETIPTGAAGAFIGGALGYGTKKATEGIIDKVKNIDAESFIDSIPGGQLQKSTIEDIMKNPQLYKAGPDVPDVVKNLAKVTTSIKDEGLGSLDKGREFLDNKNAVMQPDDKLKIIATVTKKHSKPLLDLSDDPLSSQSLMMRKKISPLIKINNNLSAKEMVSELQSLLQQIDDPKLEKKIKTLLDPFVSNIPEELRLFDPSLGKMRVDSLSGIKNDVKKLTSDAMGTETKGGKIIDEEQLLRNSVTDKGARDAKQKYMSDTSEAYRDEAIKQNPELAKYYDDTASNLRQSEVLKQTLGLKEVKTETPQIPGLVNTGTQSRSFTSELLPTSTTRKFIENYGADPKAFEQDFKLVEDVLKNKNLQHLIPEMKMAAARHYVENAGLLEGSWVKRFLSSAAAGAINTTLGKATGAASAGSGLYGTKMQAALASNNFEQVLANFKKSQAAKTGAKTLRGMGKVAPYVGTALGGLLGAGAGFAGDIVDEPTLPGVAIEGGLSAAMGIGAPAVAASMAVKPSSAGPSTEVPSEVEDSVFASEFMSPEAALESGERLSPEQKAALDKAQQEAPSNMNQAVPDTTGQDKLQSLLDTFKLPQRDFSEANEARKQDQYLKSREKILKEFKLKNKLTSLDDSSIRTLTSIVKENQSPAAQDYAKQLEDSMNLKGQERTSRLFGLMQQPGFRALIKKDSKEPQ